MLVGVRMSMQYIDSAGVGAFGGVATITPPKPSSSGVNPVTSGGYASAGSDVLPTEPITPLTAPPAPSDEITISDGMSSRGVPSGGGTGMVADTDPATIANAAIAAMAMTSWALNLLATTHAPHLRELRAGGAETRPSTLLPC